MLEKIIQIKNIGRFRDYIASGDVTFRKLTLVHAENGRGKTTLCAILRALVGNEPAFILERKTFGATGAPSVHLRIGGANHQFQNDAWNTPHPNILVFDPAFVNDNVYSGEYVDLAHKRNLYRVIVGAAGVILARKIEDLDRQIRDANGDIRNKAAGLSGYLPAGVSLDAFLQWQSVTDIDAQILRKRQEVTARENATVRAIEIRSRGTFVRIPLPALPTDFTAVLAEALPGVERCAEAKVRQHIAQHGMGPDGEPWLVLGLGYVTADKCPFCDQGVAGNDLIAAYRLHFNQGYRGLKEKVATLAPQLDAAIGATAMQTIDYAANTNAVLLEFWRQFAAVTLPLVDLADVRRKYAVLLGAAQALARAKQSSPLDVVQPDGAFQAALADVEAFRPAIEAHNQQVDAANAMVATQKAAANTDAGLAALRNDLGVLEARKKRFEVAIAAACKAYQDAIDAKAKLDAEKVTTRQALDAHCQGLMTKYQNDINDFLDQFNTGFRVTKSRHVYTGGIPSSQYQIEINSTAVDLGDAKTTTGTPCFKTALSSGDRSALALAFFLAAVKQDANIAQKVVVFDDPFTSLDRFRRTSTQQFIQRVLVVAQQVVVLSHDPFFLKLVLDGCPTAVTDAKTLQMSKSGESTVIGEWDIEEEVKSTYLKDYSVLLGFYTARMGDPRSVAMRIRPFLEGFLRSHYPGHFPATEWLGDFINRIRVADAVSGLAQEKASLGELEAINDYSKKYHHQQNPNADTELISGDELHGFVKRTLRLVGGV